MGQGSQERMEAELGDLLFAITNLGRFLALDTEEALRKTLQRFQQRFGYVEEELHAQGRHLQDATLTEMDLLWNQAKKLEKEGRLS